jgi:hypothetical protein
MFATFEKIGSIISSLMLRSHARESLFLVNHCKLTKQSGEEMCSKRCMNRDHSFKVSGWEPLEINARVIALGRALLVAIKDFNKI